MPKLTRPAVKRDVRFVDPEGDPSADVTPAPEPTGPDPSDAAPETAAEPTPAETPTEAPEAQETPAEPQPEPTEEPVAEQPTPTAPAPAKRTKPKPTARQSLFVPLEDVEDYLRVLYWGREGSGKTSASASAANIGPTLVINAEGGLKKRALAHLGVNGDNVQVWPRPGTPITHETLEEVFFQVKSDLDHDIDSWFAIVFDSGTDIVERMVDSVSTDRVEKSRGRGATIDNFDRFATDRNDYGVMSKQFRDIFRKFRDLPVHVILTALERRDVDEDTGKTVYGPAVPPGVQTDLLGYVDLVLYTREPDEDHDYYRAATKQAGKFRSKDRMHALPKVLVNPSVERLVGYVNGTLTAETDPEQAILVAEAAAAAERKAEAEARKAAAKKPATTRARPSRAKASETPVDSAANPAVE